MQYIRHIFISFFLFSISTVSVYATQYHNIWRSIQENNRDTVIQIFCYSAEYDILQPYKHPNKTSCCGSGFFIDDNGFIATNAHVVNNAVSVWVQLPSLGQLPLEVKIISVCPERDLALLQLTKESKIIVKNTIGHIPFLPMGDSDLVYRSDEIMALGYPLGESSLKMTTGVISGWQDKYIQMSAPISPGNSGGPLLNVEGKVIGINTCVAVGLGVQNIGYIVPINEFKLILSELKQFPFLKKPFMGCFYHKATPELAQYLGNPIPAGCYVTSVLKNSPLYQAGVKKGDMIYTIDGYAVDMYGDMSVDWKEDKISLIDYVSRLQVGQKVDYVIYRKGEKINTTVTFDFTKNAPIRTVYPHYEKIDFEVFGGLVVMELTINHIEELHKLAPDLKQFLKFNNCNQPVLIITHIFPEATLHKARVLREGLIINKINDIPVNTLAEFRSAITQAANSEYFVVTAKDTTGRLADELCFVCSYKQALEDTLELSQHYGYPIYKTLQELQ